MNALNEIRRRSRGVLLAVCGALACGASGCSAHQVSCTLAVCSDSFDVVIAQAAASPTAPGTYELVVSGVKTRYSAVVTDGAGRICGAAGCNDAGQLHFNIAREFPGGGVPAEVTLQVFSGSTLLGETTTHPNYAWHWCNGPNHEECNARQNYWTEVFEYCVATHSTDVLTSRGASTTSGATTFWPVVNVDDQVWSGSPDAPWCARTLTPSARPAGSAASGCQSNIATSLHQVSVFQLTNDPANASCVTSSRTTTSTAEVSMQLPVPSAQLVEYVSANEPSRGTSVAPSAGTGFSNVTTYGKQARAAEV